MLLLGLLVGWQTAAGLANIERMTAERSVVIHRVVATEVVNIARYGAERRERIDAALRDLVDASEAVAGVRLERLDGTMRAEHGAVPQAPSRDEARLGSVRFGSVVVVTGPLRIETRGCGDSAAHSAAGHCGGLPGGGAPVVAQESAPSCGCGTPRASAQPTAAKAHPEGAAAAAPVDAGGSACRDVQPPRAPDADVSAYTSCGPSCPAAGDGSLDGDYRLVLALGIAPYLELRTAVLWQGLAGGLLVLGLALGLWLFSRQAHRAADMRQALALADARAKHHESLGLVAAGLAHEIKNPVGALRGFAQLLGERVPAGSEEAEYAEIMVAELDGITRRIDGLRQLVRPRAPQWELRQPRDVVRRVAALLGPDAAARELSLEVDLPEPAEPATLVDEQRLRELVVNVVMNAIEASPHAGRIAIRLRYRGGGGRAAAGGEYTLEVQDEGTGVAPDARADCLRPFFTTKSGGLGLGLALAERAVEAHGGQLEIGDAPAGGALVRARWPRTTQLPSGSPSA